MYLLRRLLLNFPFRKICPETLKNLTMRILRRKKKHRPSLHPKHHRKRYVTNELFTVFSYFRQDSLVSCYWLLVSWFNVHVKKRCVYIFSVSNDNIFYALEIAWMLHEMFWDITKKDVVVFSSLTVSVCYFKS